MTEYLVQGIEDHSKKCIGKNVNKQRIVYVSIAGSRYIVSYLLSLVETFMLKRRSNITAFYFFDGPCESALDDIKEKFIEKFSSLRQCLRPGKCTVENVEVSLSLDVLNKTTTEFAKHCRSR